MSKDGVEHPTYGVGGASAPKRHRGSMQVCPECHHVLRESDVVLECDCGYTVPRPRADQVAEAGEGPASAPRATTTTTAPSIPDDYLLWNEAIAEVVYSTEMADRPVYLNIDDDMLEQCAALLGIDGGPNAAQDALTSVVADSLGEQSKLLAASRSWVRHWASGDMLDPPPVLPTLAAFSLAAEVMAHDEDIVSWNYYGRLWQVLGVDDRSPKQQERMQVGYRRVVLSMWEALNDWLRALGGNRGVPTAKPRGNRRYVSVAIGQALVRQAERDRLPAFFGWAGLRPGQEVAEDRMELLLGRWVTSSSAPLGNRLKRAWEKNADLRAAFADTAVAELESWDGITRRSGGQSGTLSLAAVRSRRRGFGLRIAAVGADTQPPDCLHVGDAEHSPQWREMGDGLWVDVEEPPADILAHTIRAGTLVRQQRQVTVFRREAGTYLETPAVELGERFIIVAKHGLGVVDEAINAFARPGWSAEKVGAWSVYLDVEIGQTVPHDLLPSELQPLTTLSGQALGLVGGIKLPGGPAIWKAGAPPRVVVAVPPDGSYNLSVQSEGSDPITHDLGAHEGVVERDLDGPELSPGVWRVRLVGAEEHTASFTLLSSDEPSRRWLASPETWVVRDPDTGSPSTTGEGPGSAVVGRFDNPRVAVPDLLAWVTGGEPGATSQKTRLEIANATSDVRDVQRSRVPCYEGGWHYVDQTENPHRQICDYCLVVPNSAKRATEQFRQAMSDRRGAVEGLGQDHVDALHLLDAHVHLRGGEMGRLYDWLIRIGLDGLAQAIWRKDLMALGHADFHPFAGRWSMLRPALLGHSTVDGGWLLSGGVPASDRRRLRAAVLDLGSRFDVVPLGEELRAPRTVIQNLPTEDARLVATEVETLEVHPQAGLELARRLPPLSHLVAAGPMREYGRDTRARRYDPTVARWAETSRAIDEAGAYRVGPGYRDEFWWVAEDGEASLLPDGETAKLLAGRLEDVPQMAYVDGAVATPLGARLPPLYERAVVLSSFLLPEEVSGQTTYAHVPEPVAGMVYSALHDDPPSEAP